eukprot:2449363-Prymnesium_polylepis.1
MQFETIPSAMNGAGLAAVEATVITFAMPGRLALTDPSSVADRADDPTGMVVGATDEAIEGTWRSAVAGAGVASGSLSAASKILSEACDVVGC